MSSDRLIWLCHKFAVKNPFSTDECALIWLNEPLIRLVSTMDKFNRLLHFVSVRDYLRKHFNRFVSFCCMDKKKSSSKRWFEFFLYTWFHTLVADFHFSGFKMQNFSYMVNCNGAPSPFSCLVISDNENYLPYWIENEFWVWRSRVRVNIKMKGFGIKRRWSGNKMCFACKIPDQHYEIPAQHSKNTRSTLIISLASCSSFSSPFFMSNAS